VARFPRPVELARSIASIAMLFRAAWATSSSARSCYQCQDDEKRARGGASGPDRPRIGAVLWWDRERGPESREALFPRSIYHCKDCNYVGALVVVVVVADDEIIEAIKNAYFEWIRMIETVFDINVTSSNTMAAIKTGTLEI